MRKRTSQVSPITPVWRRKLAAFQFPLPLEARALLRTASYVFRFMRSSVFGWLFIFTASSNIKRKSVV